MTVPSTQSGLKNIAARGDEDLLHGFGQVELWGRLGWQEVKRRYRRTALGPFWTAISLFVFVMALGSVGAGLLSRDMHDYLPFLVAGMVVWIMLSTIITEACTLFVSGAALVRQTRFNYSILAYALVWRNLIVFLHNMIVWAVIYLIFAPDLINWKIVLAIPGLAFVFVNGVWISLLLGMLCLRFRDVQQLVTSLVQIALFVTPIFWPPDKLDGMRRIIFVGLNPIYHHITIIRDPLMGQLPALNSYIAVILITVGGWTLTYFLFNKFRKRIPYWS